MTTRETWQIDKPTVFGARGLVAAQNARAAEVGAEILRKGGNAVDAAVATGFALGVTEPWMSGIGGGGLILIRPAHTGDPVVVDATMVASRNLDPADYPLAEGSAESLFRWPAVVGDRNMTGATSICVPGLVDGYRAAWERFGSLAWPELVEPARAIAAQGLLIDWYTTLNISLHASRLRRFPGSVSHFLPDGLPPVPAAPPQPSFLGLGALPESLAKLRDEGPRALYEGPLAAAIARDVQKAGGSLGNDDLSSYRAAYAVPLRTPYRNASIYSAPGLTGGPTLARALEELEGRVLKGRQPGPGAYLAYADVLSRAFAERLERMGAAGGESSTSHVTVADGDGNVVALTQTLLSRFGSALVLPESGILMNNGVLWFDPVAGKPNSIAPGRRPLANMCPVISVGRDGRVVGCGACGGRRIIAAVLQILSFVEDYGMDPATALATPRIDVSGEPDLLVDVRLSEEVVDALSEHHATVRMEGWVYPEEFAVPNLVCHSPVSSEDTLLSGAAFPQSPWAHVASA